MLSQAYLVFALRPNPSDPEISLVRNTRLLSKHFDVLYKHLVATLSTALAVLVLVAACTNSNDDESTSPVVTQDVVTSEAAESEQVNEEGVFLRVIAPLDEARGYCLDIPGHRAGVQIANPLQVHTCKHGVDAGREPALARFVMLRFNKIRA